MEKAKCTLRGREGVAITVPVDVTGISVGDTDAVEDPEVAVGLTQALRTSIKPTKSVKVRRIFILDLPIPF